MGEETSPPGAAARIVLAAIEAHGPQSRKQLALSCDLPTTTVTSATGRLLALGLLEELTPRRTAGSRGRPPRVLTLPARRPVAALVVGHQTLQAAVVTVDGVVQAGRSAAFEPFESDDVVGPACDLLEQVLQESGTSPRDLVGAVLSLPRPYLAGHRGPWRAGGPMGGPRWFTTDPAPDLRRRLKVPAVAENDANLAALGETVHGAARGMRDVIHIKLVPGLGVGLVVNGDIVRGARGQAGELGHLQLDEHGPVCVCGSRGCLVKVLNNHEIVEALRPSYPQALTFEDVVSLASGGEPAVHRVLGDLGRALGPSMAASIALVDPEAVVVDGSLGAGAAPFIEGLREAVGRRLPPYAAQSVRYLHGVLADQAELLGAAALAAQVHLYRRKPA